MPPLPSVEGTIAFVLQVAQSVTKHSWEFGSVSEALLEWENRDLSIWNNPFPNGKAVPTLDVPSINALGFIKPQINIGSDTRNLNLNQSDGSAGDPAALGIAALMIGQTPEGNIDSSYYKAAVRQYEHLTIDVPRKPNGAISHREAPGNQLWADFIYMAPPFMAYYGVVSDNVAILKDAAEQCKKYDEILGTPGGPWNHITDQDMSLWSTGNGWAVAGMSRVLATMRKSAFDQETKAEQSLLSSLIQKIIDGMIKLDLEVIDRKKPHNEKLLHNYLDQQDWFEDIAGTSLIAATVFRMSVLEPQTFGASYVDWAKDKKEAVDARIDLNTGTVSPVVNPLAWWDRTAYNGASPEGQSFVVLMHAAYRDWEEVHVQSQGPAQE